MLLRINRPTDPYSKLWGAYWDQNPKAHRSVGAAGDPDPTPDPGANPDPAPTIDPADFAKLQQTVASYQEDIEKLKTNNQALLKEKKDAKTAAELATEEAARKSGNIEAIEKSWADKYAALESVVTEKDGLISNMTAGNAAQSLAQKLALPDCDDGLLPHIKPRITTEYVDGKPILRILDKDGKPSAMNMDDLEKEIRSTPYLASLIVGSQANGSGPVGGKGNPAQATMKRSDFEALSISEQSALGSKIAKKELILND